MEWVLFLCIDIITQFFWLFKVFPTFYYIIIPYDLQVLFISRPKVIIIWTAEPSFYKL